MTQSSLQADAFYKDVARTKKVWGIKDKSGIPAPIGDKGKRAMPFWSSPSRVQKIIETADAYAGFETFELAWDVFRDRWLPGLEKDGLMVGVNWSGSRAVGYDVEPTTVKEAIEFQINNGRGA
jgi:hypothetical protein